MAKIDHNSLNYCIETAKENAAVLQQQRHHLHVSGCTKMSESIVKIEPLTREICESFPGRSIAVYDTFDKGRWTLYNITSKGEIIQNGWTMRDDFIAFSFVNAWMLLPVI